MTFPAAPNRDQTRGDLLVEWFKGNTKLVAVGAAILVVAAAGFWLFERNQRVRAENAVRMLMSAKMSLRSGNISLAQADLERVAERYKGTAAGAESGILLGKLYYDQQRYDEGISALEGAAGSAPAAMVGAIRALVGDGLLEMGRAGDAARAYEEAAAATPFDGERASLVARAARAYTAAGDVERARQLWSGLIADRKNLSAAAEARVRLGELNAKPAGAS